MGRAQRNPSRRAHAEGALARVPAAVAPAAAAAARRVWRPALAVHRQPRRHGSHPCPAADTPARGPPTWQCPAARCGQPAVRRCSCRWAAGAGSAGGRRPGALQRLAACRHRRTARRHRCAGVPRAEPEGRGQGQHRGPPGADRSLGERRTGPARSDGPRRRAKDLQPAHQHPDRGDARRSRTACTTASPRCGSPTSPARRATATYR